MVQLIWYLLIAETMELGKVRHDVQIAEEVKDGSIAYILTRPYNYLGYHLARGLAESLIRMSSVFLLGLPIVWWHVGSPTFLSWSTAAVFYFGLRHYESGNAINLNI